MKPVLSALMGALILPALALPVRAAEPFRDCADCPELVVIPAGAFMMGKEGGEPGRPDGPIRKITFEQPFAIGVHEITYRQYATFIADTGYSPTDECSVLVDKMWGMRDWADWQNPGLGRNPLPEEPVACVNWNDSKAFTDWLAEKTGLPYRLPTEAEFEYVQRDGGQSTFPWGEDVNDGCGEANMYDPPAAEWLDADWEATSCEDGYAGPAPVGSLQANGYGVHDISGNLWEWLEDCYVAPYPEDAPRDGSAHQVEGECKQRAVRGASWETGIHRQVVGWRGRDYPTWGFRTFGFRVARDLMDGETP